MSSNHLILALALFLNLQSCNCESGIASQYAPGVMERVVRTRQAGRTARNLPKELPDVDGFIAVANCNEIGQIWTIRHKGVEERFLVADCAGSIQTVNWMTRNKILAEVDGATAKRWNTVGRGAKIEVCKKERYVRD